MLYLVLALVALGVISAVFSIISHRKGEDEEPLQEGVSCNTCNGDTDHGDWYILASCRRCPGMAGNIEGELAKEIVNV